ncbi:cation:proton antiporter [Candidatus Woesearchaeota archaeon]|nr:cation:proton antiporter [Candidatus Woesearchaeota archaeon]
MDKMANILLAMFTALVLAFLFSEIFKRFGLPRVIGQILAGIILGLPIIKSSLFTDETTPIFSFATNLGIILLFFFIGLEINLVEFRKNFKESSLIAVFNTLVPLLAGFLAAKFLFGFNNIASLVLGISVSVSSQAISLDILEELKLLKSKIGNLIIASGTVDDVFELLLISSLLVVFHSAIGQIGLQNVILDIGIFVIMAILFRVLVIPLGLKFIGKETSHSAFFMRALIIVLLMSYISELLGVGSLIGALIAGMLVRQTLMAGESRKPWRMNEISHSIHMISFGFLIPLFFVSVGLNTNINAIPSNLFLVLVFIVIDLLGTLLGTIIGVLLSKGTFREGMIVGWGVIPKGDTELVIATLALNGGLITADIFTVIITVALFSTFLAPIVFKLLVKRHHAAKTKVYKNKKK